MKNSEKYPWTFTMSPITGVPMFDSPLNADLPSEFFPRSEYTDKLTEIGKLVAKNEEMNNSSRITSPTNKQLTTIHELTEAVSKKYSDLFTPNPKLDRDLLDKRITILSREVESYFDREIPLDGIKTTDPDLAMYDVQYQAFPRPETANYIYDDDFFAYWRVAGSNPVALRGVSSLPSNFPLTEEQYQQVMGSDDSLADALKERRIYMLNYDYLDGAVTGDVGYHKPELPPNHPTVKPCFSYLAMALFAVSKKSKLLKSVSIQCGQDPDDDNPMFLATEDDDRRWGWERAKLVVQTADKTEHQLSSHLGLTHLLCEAFSLATYRNLTPGHAVYDLLISHFEGTNRINHNAILGLLAPEQFVDNLMAAPLGDLAKKAVDIRLDYNFYDHFLPKELELRGVDDTEALPDYPYRDDGMLIWNAIHKWVTDYISHFYITSAQIASDVELNAWIDDLVDNGKIKGFKKITTRVDLIDVLTMVIFTSSAQHAAVNFPQHDWMMYAPAMAGLLSYHKPTTIAQATKEEWLQMLPGQWKALSRLSIYTFLGTLYNGHLGEYVLPSGEEIFTQEKDPKVYKLLTDFRNELDKITLIINERNQTRLYPYKTLIPSNIPPSINI